MAKKTESSIIALQNLKGFVVGANLEPAQFIPTGHPQLDYAIASGVLQDADDDTGGGIYSTKVGSGGVPLGKMVELAGEEGGGKSSIAYRICGNAQKMGYNAAWIDAEHSFSAQLAKINGCDPAILGYSDLNDPSDPEKIYDAEAILDMMLSICQSGKYNVIVLDSVAFMTPRYVMENPSDKQGMSVLARLLSAQLPKLANYAAKNNVLIVFINQIREKVGVLWGNPESTPGGRAIKHACSVRLKITKMKSKDAIIEIENEQGEDETIGGKAYVQIVKNRFAAPVRESIEIPIYYKYYFPNTVEHIFNAGRQLNVIRVNKGTYSYSNDKDSIKVEGKLAFLDALQKSDLLINIASDIQEKAGEKEIVLPPEVSYYIESQKKADGKTATQTTPKKSKSKKNKEVELVEDSNPDL